jgi:Flp pilus assembly protein TadB
MKIPQLWVLFPTFVAGIASILVFWDIFEALEHRRGRNRRKTAIFSASSNDFSRDGFPRSQLLEFERQVESIGNRFVQKRYREALQNLTNQVGAKSEDAIETLVKRKIYFAFTGFLLSFLFFLRQEWSLLPLTLLLTSSSYFFPNLLSLIGRWSRTRYARKLTALAAFSGSRWQSPKSLFAIKFILAIATFFVCYTYAFVKSPSLNGLLISLSFVFIGFFLPDLLIYNKVIKRREKFEDTFPDAIDLLSMCVNAGLAFPGALARVADTQKGPVPEEFSRVRMEVQLGKDRNQALLEMAGRVKVESLREFVSAVSQVDRFGIPISRALQEQSRELRAKRTARGREKAQKVPIKILGPVMICFLPCVLLIVLGPAIIGIMRAF